MFQPSEKLPLTAKQKVLFTAHDLFYADGIRATGIDKIIAQAQVTKTTFYRHFPSKNSLIIAYLEYRHVLWLDWFKQIINQHNDLADGIATAMFEWFKQDSFRGCAFVNSLSEISAELPEVKALVSEHKQDVADVVKVKLKKTPDSNAVAQAIVMTMDGAIVRAQSGEEVEQTTSLLYKTVCLLSRA